MVVLQSSDYNNEIEQQQQQQYNMMVREPTAKGVVLTIHKTMSAETGSVAVSGTSLRDNETPRNYVMHVENGARQNE